MQYSKIRNRLNTGDIVLFSGNGFISRAIQAVTHSKWSHVGMILNLPEYDFVGVWESTTLSKTKDVLSGKLVSGVQLVPLSKRIAMYNGTVSVRLLDGYPILPETTEVLKAIRQEFQGRPYEINKWELVKSALDLFLHNDEDLSSLFCSELVAECLQRLKIIDESKPSNEYTPADFSRASALRTRIGRYSTEIQIEG